jgi:hypothetical protein
MSDTLSNIPERPKLSSFPRLYLAIVLLMGASVVFMAIQNTTNAVGGHISLPKTLWLDWNLTTFYVMPFFLWKNLSLSPAPKSLFGWLLFSFFVRGIAELIVIYLQLPRALQREDRLALHFLPIYVATLIFESINAWEFSQLADPAKGVYFAAATPHFAFVNELTWFELACLWPWFCWLLWKCRTQFSLL